MNIKSLGLVGLAVAGIACSSMAVAGEWSVSLDSKGGNRVEVIATFNGDAITEEAQIDLKPKGAFVVEKVESLISGSVCVGSAEKGILRAVPPSGAGTGLAKSAHDTCVFTIRFLQKELLADFAAQFDVSFAECASSKVAGVACTHSIRQLGGSDKGQDANRINK